MKNLKFIPLSLLLFSLSMDAYSKCIKGGCMEGQGALTLPNGDRYIGQFKADLKEGQGVYTYANGTQYDGAYKNNH